MKSYQVFIADDHPLVRMGLQVVLEESSRYSICGESDNIEDLMKFFESKTVTVDVLILDLKMPLYSGMKGDAQYDNPADSLLQTTEPFSGLNALKKLKLQYPDLPILVLTEHFDPAIIYKARENNANGYILKDEMVEKIVESLDRIIEGVSVYSGKVNLALNFSSKSQEAMAQLTTRELELLKLIVNGDKDRSIANRMGVSPRTIAFHKANLKEKLGAESTAEIIKIYYSGDFG